MKKVARNKISHSDLNKKLSKNEISPVYVFTGDQIYLMDQAVEELKKRVLGGSADFNFSLFYGDSTSVKDIINSAKTYPMLSNLRLVVVKNTEKLPENELKLLEHYVSSPSPSTCLVLIFMEEKKLSTENQKDVLLVDFVLDTKDMTRTIKEEARKLGYDITKDAAETLVSLVGANLQNIHSELQKLATFTGNREKIESQDVERLTEQSQFKDVFQLINAISEKNKKKALKVLLELESTNEDPLSILNKISWRFRLIWKAKELIDKKVPEKAILRELRVSSGALYYIGREANNFHYEDIKRINSVIYDGDISLKTSGATKNLILTKLVLELCD
jgi:DNA polymerase-3 subunit delta